MTFLNKLSYAILITLSICQISFAQKNNKKIVIIVEKDQSLKGLDTAILTYQTEFDLSIHRQTTTSLLCSADKPAIFEYIPTTKVTRAYVNITGESKKGLAECYFEPGDSIVMKVSGTGLLNTTVKFEGKGAVKIQLRQQLDSLVYANGVTLLKERYTPIILKVNKYRMDLLVEEQLKLIERAKPLLSNLVYQLFIEDVVNNASAFKYKQARRALLLNNYNPIFTEYMENLLSQKLDIEVTEAKLMSKNYLQSFVGKAHLKISTVQNKEFTEIDATYNELKKAVSGILLEKLLYYYLSNLPKGSSEEYVTCIEDALTIINDKGDKKVLEDLLAARGRGHKAYDFTLLNEQGKKIKLSDFQGKVILLHFWFSGCPACLHLNKVLEKDVLPNFDNKKDFVHITINADTDKNRWLKSVSSGQYTSSNSINLYTMGEGTNAEVIKKYKVLGYPTIIVIDKEGKIYNSNIKRESQKIINSINEVL